MATALEPVFKARDNSEHKTEAAAKRRNSLLEAVDGFEEAAKKVRRALGENAQTADGEPFDTSRWRSYWYVAPNFSGLPRLHKVDVWPYDVNIERDRDDANLYWLKSDEGDRRNNQVRYRISSLYASEDRAKEALVEACHKRMDELAEEVKAIIASVQKSR